MSKNNEDKALRSEIERVGKEANERIDLLISDLNKYHAQNEAFQKLQIEIKTVLVESQSYWNLAIIILALITAIFGLNSYYATMKYPIESIFVSGIIMSAITAAFIGLLIRKPMKRLDDLEKKLKATSN